MSDRELLEQIARSLEGEDEVIEKCRVAFERCEQASRINKETRAENIRALDQAVVTMTRLGDKLDDRDAFISDVVRRAEIAGQRSDAWFELMLGRIEALTDAVWRLVDRFDEGSSTA